DPAQLGDLLVRQAELIALLDDPLDRKARAHLLTAGRLCLDTCRCGRGSKSRETENHHVPSHCPFSVSTEPTLHCGVAASDDTRARPAVGPGPPAGACSGPPCRGILPAGTPPTDPETRCAPRRYVAHPSFPR